MQRQANNMTTHGLAVAGFVALTMVLTYPQILVMDSELPSDAEGRIVVDALQNAWILAWTSHALRTDPRHLFDGNAFHPRRNVIAYSDHMLGTQVFAAPLYWATGNIALVVNVLVFVSFVLCGYGAFALAMELTGNGWASFLAGIIFAFNPHRVAHYAFTPVLSTYWIPFVVLFLWRYLRRGRLADALCLAGFHALQALSSGQMWMLSNLALALLLTGSAVWDRHRRPRRLVASCAALALGLALALPAFVPHLRLQRDMGFARRVEEADMESADLLSFVTVPDSNWGYGPIGGRLADTVIPAFPGLICIALAICALRHIRRRPATERTIVIVFVWATVGLGLLALGPHVKLNGNDLCLGPYWPVYRLVPGFDALRAPTRIVGIMMLPAACLAAFGVARVVASWRARWIPCALIVAMLGEYASVPVRLAHVPSRKEAPEVYRWLARQPGDFAVLELHLDLRNNDSLFMYFSTFHWKRLVNGYLGAVAPENSAKFMTFVHFPSPESLDVLRQLDVRYVVFRPELLPVETDPATLPEDLRKAAEFDDAIVYEVLKRGVPRRAARAQVPARRLPRTHWEIAGAPGLGTQAMVDGNAETIWRSKTTQKAGDGIVVAFQRPQAIGGIELEFGWAANYFPRYFVIELEDETGAWRQVAGKGARRRMYADLYMACLETPRNPTVSVRFPGQLARRIRIRLVKDALLPWMIAELSILIPEGH